jgi:hypothetical protein
MEHGTQVRCRDCATGWVTVSSQEDLPSAPHRLCEACIRKVHSQRTERRAQDPKPRGRQAQKKSNRGRPRKSNVRDEDDDGDEPAAPPPAPPPAPRSRGHPPKQRPNTGPQPPSQQHHRPLHEPGDALRNRDLTPTAVKPRSPHLPCRCACGRDTPGAAQT